MLIPCINCNEEYHISWAREWDINQHQYVAIPSNEFVCVSCKVKISKGVKK